MELANAGDAGGIIRRVTSDVVSSPETCTVSMTAEALGLPAGGSVRLVISGIDYDETVTADADGNVSFVVPLIAVDSTVTVELSVMDANGTLLWYGSKTEQVSDGFNLDITLTGQAGALPVTVDKTVLTATATSAELATITITGATETPLLTPSSSLLNIDPPVQDASDPETYTVSVGIPGGTAPVWFADDTAVSVTVTVGTEEYTVAFTLKNKYTVEVQYASPTGNVDAAEIGTFLQGSPLAFSTVATGASSVIPAGREAVAFKYGSNIVLYKNASGGATSVTISNSNFSGLMSRTIILEPVLDFTCSRSDGGYGTTASPLSSQTGTSANPYLLNYYGTDTNKNNQIELEIGDNTCADSALTIDSTQTAIVSATFDITHTGSKFLVKIKPTLAENSVYTTGTIKLTITDPTTGAKKDIHVLLKKNKLGSKTAPDAVGDIVFTDGSASPYTDFDTVAMSSDQVAGAVAVIFDVSGGCKGIGLKQGTGLSWAAEGSAVYVLTISALVATKDSGTFTYNAVFSGAGATDGSGSLAKFRTAVGAAEGTLLSSTDYPAWAFVESYATTAGLTGTYESGWYMPSIQELCTLCEARTAVNNALDKISSATRLDTSSGLYWSSSNSNADIRKSWYLDFQSLIPIYANRKNAAQSVCVIRAF